MINVNDFHGTTDSEVIERAIMNRPSDGIIVIPPRVSEIEPERTYWLIDRAILIPADTTIILQNCMIKLSDRCRDNFFRTANCGPGIANPEKIRNVHIRGEGLCTLQGADHPRSTGDGSKIQARPCPYIEEDMLRYGYWLSEEKKASGELGFWDMHDHSYGTDAGKEGVSQNGGKDNWGILFVNVEHFSIENLRLVDFHGWGITIEYGSYGSIKNIDFDACMSKEIDGLRQNMENQDGVHLCEGSHHIVISDITGRTGDDVIAFTTNNRIDNPDNSDAYIHDIMIRNVIAYSQLCFVIRLWSINSRMWNIVIDGIIDAAPKEAPHGQYSSTILIGRHDTEWGKHLRDGVKNITISNVICNARKGIDVYGYLQDSSITNVCNRHPEGSVITVRREDGLDNVVTSSLCAAGNNPIFESEDAPPSPAI